MGSGSFLNSSCCGDAFEAVFEVVAGVAKGL
jgi:hypothetical protein